MTFISDGTGKDIPGLFDYMTGIIAEISDGYLRQLVGDFFVQFDEFWSCPGAVHDMGHHLFEGGLAYHTYHATKIAMMLADSYLDQGVQLDKDIVICGTLLHDIGKALGYERIEDPDGVTYRKTSREKLHHHIPTGYHRFLSFAAAHEYADKFDQGKIDHIAHVILSHHGRKAWSSPVCPQTVEAYLVHAVEMMDAYVDGYARGRKHRDLYT